MQKKKTKIFQDNKWDKKTQEFYGGKKTRIEMSLFPFSDLPLSFNECVHIFPNAKSVFSDRRERLLTFQRRALYSG